MYSAKKKKTLWAGTVRFHRQFHVRRAKALLKEACFVHAAKAPIRVDDILKLSTTGNSYERGTPSYVQGLNKKDSAPSYADAIGKAYLFQQLDFDFDEDVAFGVFAVEK